MLVETARRDRDSLLQEVRRRTYWQEPGSPGAILLRFKPSNERIECTVVLKPFTDDADDEELNLELSATLVHLLARLSARPETEFMRTVEQAFEEGLLHNQTHVARPYDYIANLRTHVHYDVLAGCTHRAVPRPSTSQHPVTQLDSREPWLRPRRRPATPRWKISGEEPPVSLSYRRS